MIGQTVLSGISLAMLALLVAGGAIYGLVRLGEHYIKTRRPHE